MDVAAVPGTDPMVGCLLNGRYLIGKKVARGGMATVYEATDNRLQRTVAIKVMHAGLAEDAEFVRRFQREARSAALLSHPNVVAVFDQGFDQQTGVGYLTMEYVPGRTLRGLLRQHGPLDPATALELLDPMLAALAAAHDAGLVHRDIKPENVLLGVDGAVKVADFGLARAVSGASTATQGLLIGTVSYLAPEQLTGSGADTRTDIYAAGVVLFEMLTGCKPHEGDTPIQIAYKHVNEDIPPPSSKVPALPSFVDGLVLRSTARDPDVRPADAGVLLRYVRRARAALREGIDDPGLAEDLLSFRRPPHSILGADPEPVIPLPKGFAVDESELERQDGVEHTSVVRTGPSGRSSGHRPGARARRRARPNSFAVRRNRRAIFAVLVVFTLVAGIGGWWLGVERYTEVPRSLDADRGRLAELCRTAGLNCRVTGLEWDDAIAAGHVVRSAPMAGERILDGSTVQVWLSKGPERHPMPRVEGRLEHEARKLIETAKLRVASVDRVYRDTVPAGQVIRTTPSAGTVLAKGSSIRLVISKGAAPVDIPQVVGQPVADAERQLKALGLEPTVDEEFSDTIARGLVISQDPEPGIGHRGDAVKLVVSEGPEFPELPSVRGLPEAMAKKKLETAGFVVIVKKNSLYFGAGLVAKQIPESGTRTKAGSTVILEIV